MKINNYVIYLFASLTILAVTSCKDSSKNTTSYVYNYLSCDGRTMSVTVVPSTACNAVSETAITVGSTLGGGVESGSLKLDLERIAAWTVPGTGENITTIASRYGLTVESVKTIYNSGVPVTVSGAYITVAILDIPHGHSISEYLTNYGQSKPSCSSASSFGNDSEIQFATPVFDYYGNDGIQNGYVPITDQFQVWFKTTSGITPQFNQALNVGLRFSYSTGDTVTWLLQTTKQSPGNALEMVMLYTSSGFICGETDWQTIHLF
ncbi:MAG: hypothetical protein ACP5OF_09425 [bacterium]